MRGWVAPRRMVTCLTPLRDQFCLFDGLKRSSLNVCSFLIVGVLGYSPMPSWRLFTL